MDGARNQNRKSTLTIGDLVSRYELSNITKGKSSKTITGIQTSCARSKLFDEICNLFSWNEEQGIITDPLGHIVGIPVTTMDSAQQVKMLPKIPPNSANPLTNTTVVPIIEGRDGVYQSKATRKP